MKLVAVERAAIEQSQWDDLVAHSDEAWFFHLYSFQPTLATWPNYRERSFALVNEADGKLAAIVPCYLGTNRTIECFGGPATSQDLTDRQRAATHARAHQELARLASEDGCGSIFTRLSQMSPAWRGRQCPRVNPLIFFGYSNDLSQTYVIDLEPSIDRLWSMLLPYCRTHIRKAEKEGCSVRTSSGSVADLDIYYEMHCKTYHRSGISPHPREYFEAIWRNFVKEGLAVIFIAEKDGRAISADNEIHFKSAMSGWTAAGFSDASRIGANNLLHWRAMCWAKEAGAELYESGEAFPGAKGGKEKGLDSFKKSFGGKLFPIYRGRMDIEPQRGEATSRRQTLLARAMRRVLGIRS